MNERPLIGPIMYIHVLKMVRKCSCAIISIHASISSQAQVDEQLAGLQTLTAARRSKLEESIKLHQYIRDVDEVVSWVREKETVASSDDYGKDFDHLLVMVYVQ